MSSSRAVAVVLCDVLDRGNGSLQARLTRFRSVDGALAAAEAVPCRAGCAGVHIVCWRNGGAHERKSASGNLVYHSHVAVEIVDHRVRRSLAAELEACYPRTPDGLPAEHWPIADELNTPLGSRPVMG
jgi:hypothetical protein